MSLAAKLPYDHPFAGGYPGIGSQPLPTDADALDYLSRMATADGAGVETGVAVAVDAFFRDAKELGVFSSIRASCVLAGARTLAGALVPLRDYGPELWDAPTPTIFTAQGSSGSYDSATLTMNSLTTSPSAFTPRFIFDLGLVAGKTYKVAGRLSGDTTLVGSVRLGSSPLTYNLSTGEISGSIPAVDSNLIVYFNSTLGPASATIESLSIREVIAAPTNVADGFVEGDFSRTAGLTGDGTSYIDSGRAADDDPLNDAHLAVHVSESATSNTHYKAGAYNSGTQQTILRSNFGSFLSAVNSGNFASAGGGNDVGLFGASRFAADSSEFRLLGVTTPDSTASGAASTQSVTIFARNDGTPDGFFDGTIAFYSIGTSLSLEDLDTAVTNLINRLKFALLVGENPSPYDIDTVAYVVRGYENGGTLE